MTSSRPFYPPLLPGDVAAICERGWRLESATTTQPRCSKEPQRSRISEDAVTIMRVHIILFRVQIEDD